jgi:hypothetical protein
MVSNYMQSSQPIDVATCMDYTGLDPFTGEEVYTARHLRDRELQRALLQFFKPENDFEVREALLKAGRADLIGAGCDALIPAQPPKAALRARIEKAGRALSEGRYVHTIAEPDPAEPKPKPEPTPPPRTKGSRSEDGHAAVAVTLKRSGRCPAGRGAAGLHPGRSPRV